MQAFDISGKTGEINRYTNKSVNHVADSIRLFFSRIAMFYKSFGQTLSEPRSDTRKT
jgi:hypothetical protein